MDFKMMETTKINNRERENKSHIKIKRKDNE